MVNAGSNPATQTIFFKEINMLVVDVKINCSPIDKIYIRRIDNVKMSDPIGTEYEYEVLTWDNNDNTWKKRVDKNVKCVYGDYRLLLKKVLEELTESE